MKNGIVSITVFDALCNIASTHGRSDRDWAEATWGKREFQSRISELRSLSTRQKQGITTKTGRAFTISKLKDLMAGLDTMLGGETVRKELLKAIEKTESSKEKLLLLVLALPDTEVEQAILYLKAAVSKS